jgi:Putative adhesin
VNRTITLVLLAAVSLSAPPANARTEVAREQSQATVDARGLHDLLVENARGDIQLRPSSDGALHITALKIIHAPDQQRSRTLAREIRVETQNEGGRYHVHVIYPHRQEVHISFWDLFQGEFDLPRVEVRLALDVPDGLPVVLRTSSGDVDTDGISGSQEIHTTSGDVGVQSARSPVRIETSSGDVTAAAVAAASVHTSSGDVSVDGVGGPLRLRTTSGDMVIAGARDSLDVSTSSGEVRIDAAPRGLTLATGSGGVEVAGAGGLVLIVTRSGDVEIGLARTMRGADITTTSGDVRARMAASLACTLDLQTSSGTFDVTVPIQIRTATRRRLSGSVRGGTLPIHMQTLSGDIDVQSGGQ